MDVCLILEGCIMVRAFCASLAVGYYDGNWILPLKGVLYLKKLKNRCVITHKAMSWYWCGAVMIMA